MRPAWLGLLILVVLSGGAAGMERVRVSADGVGFELVDSGDRFRPWGVNYDHDEVGGGRLLESYWDDEWEVVAGDFAEIKGLGANLVRVHLQVGAFMESEAVVREGALERLGKLLVLAERSGLYLDLTGLGCYHKDEVPAWYDALDEVRRWAVQARFWEGIAERCAGSPAVFCYDLMNEPVVAGKKGETKWLAGEFGGKTFVQRISLDLGGRTREEVVEAWAGQMVGAIRKHDDRALVTVGVIPWALTFPGAKPVFYGEGVRDAFDFVSVHFYPERGKVEAALEALAVYQIGKPVGGGSFSIEVWSGRAGGFYAAGRGRWAGGRMGEFLLGEECGGIRC